MKLWYKVNLPTNKLTKLGHYLSLYPNNPKTLNYTCITQPKIVLSSDLIDLFSKLDLTPWVVVFFTNPSVQNFLTLQIHSDVSGLGNYRWQKISGGISFEVNPSTRSKFRWFDTSKYTECYPKFNQENFLPSYNVLHGVHYGQRGYTTVLDATEIENVSIDQPLLVRTDIAHAVTYTTDYGMRCGVSIRFKESLDSWENLARKIYPILE
jgi:hypothetical protein